MSTDYADYERAVERGKANKIIARIARHAAQIRQRDKQPEQVALPKREVPDSYIYTRNWLGFLRKRPTVNTRVRKLMSMSE